MKKHRVQFEIEVGERQDAGGCTPLKRTYSMYFTRHWVTTYWGLMRVIQNVKRCLDAEQVKILGADGCSLLRVVLDRRFYYRYVVPRFPVKVGNCFKTHANRMRGIWAIRARMIAQAFGMPYRVVTW